MIKRLKLRVIILSSASLLMLFLVLIFGMNTVNYRMIVKEADSILLILSRTQNKMHDNNEFSTSESPLPALDQGINPDSSKDLSTYISHSATHAVPADARYFSVKLDQLGNIAAVDMSDISTIDQATAEFLAKQAVNANDAKGFCESFRYLRYQNAIGEYILFLDIGEKLESFYTFLSINLLITSCGFVLGVLLISILARRIVRPIAETHSKQKRFITDAGHEIKTPLAIIQTNVDILEMEFGDNESLYDIKQQVTRLSSLTEDLVYLARIEETDTVPQKLPFPISDVIKEVVEPYFALAKTDNKHFICHIQPSLTFCGNHKSIRQLISILMDNANKYSPNDGTISLSLLKQNRSLVLSVTNSTNYEIDKSILDRVFDRFYRADPSRNSSINGYGIGLSLALAIVNEHNGKIHAESGDSTTFTIRISLPI